MRRTVLLVLGLSSSVAAAQPVSAPAVKLERAIVVGRIDDGVWTDRPAEARLDQRVELSAVVVARRGRKPVLLAPEGVEHVKLGGKRVKVEPLANARLQWSTVEPYAFRAKPAANGATSDFYSNVSLDPKRFGQWLGHDRIDTFERVIQGFAATATSATLPVKIVSSEAGAQQLPGLGTLRYKVEVELDGQRVASPGAEASDRYGLLPSVYRVSIRRADDFLGHLSAYLLVPEVFGSAGAGRNHQTERFTGADCADVMVGAARRMGRRVSYTNVAGLTAYARLVIPPVELDAQGNPARPIDGVRPGDLIRIDYGGTLRGHTPRAYDHVAALWEDRSDPAGPSKGGPDGQLDGFDLVIHMAHPRLLIEPLAKQSPATVDVLRWR